MTIMLPGGNIYGALDIHRHCSKSLMYIMSDNPHDNSIKRVCYSHFTNKKTKSKATGSG